MAYPASEVIANTIAEAINAADQISFWDYASAIGALAGGIGGVATFFLLLVELKKLNTTKIQDREERAKVRSIARLQKIEKQHLKILSFMLKNDEPNNNRTMWNKAYLELQKLHSIDLVETNEIKEEAKKEREDCIEQLKSILLDGDPEMESLRWQFFTGTKHWQNNHETWDQIQKKVNIGSAFLHQDHFGNYYKKDGVKNISPYHALAIYNFIYAGKCPSEDDIKFPTIDTAPKTKAELTRSILIDGISPTWLNDYGNEGLIYYLFEFYTRPIDESVNKIHS